MIDYENAVESLESLADCLAHCQVRVDLQADLRPFPLLVVSSTTASRQVVAGRFGFSYWQHRVIPGLLGQIIDLDTVGMRIAAGIRVVRR